MSEKKRAEIRALFDRGTFKIILRKDVPPDAKILAGRFIASTILLVIKSTENGQTKFKARYVISGHRARMKDMMVHDAATL